MKKREHYCPPLPPPSSHLFRAECTSQVVRLSLHETANLFLNKPKILDSHFHKQEMQLDLCPIPFWCLRVFFNKPAFPGVPRHLYSVYTTCLQFEEKSTFLKPNTNQATYLGVQISAHRQRKKCLPLMSCATGDAKQIASDLKELNTGQRRITVAHSWSESVRWIICIMQTPLMRWIWRQEIV